MVVCLLDVVQDVTLPLIKDNFEIFERMLFSRGAEAPIYISPEGTFLIYVLTHPSNLDLKCEKKVYGTPLSFVMYCMEFRLT